MQSCEPVSTAIETPRNVSGADLTRTFDLVQRAQGGDDDAFGRLSARYYPRLRAVVRKKLSAKLRTMMESGDIVQETFYQAMRGFDRFEMRDRSSFINWLAKIAERTIMAVDDYFRTHKRIVLQDCVPIVLDDREEALPIADENAADVAERAALNEERRLVRRCLWQLRFEQRMSIVLHVYMQWPWQQVAAALGKPSADSARMAYKTAREELQRKVFQCLAEQGPRQS